MSIGQEWSFLVRTFEPSTNVERLHHLKIEAAHIPDWGALVAPGGHGKTQFAVQAQYLIGQFPSTELVICAGAAGSLSPQLSVGDIVVGTETVEHYYRLLFASRPLPRFPGHGPSIDSSRAAVFNGIGSLESAVTDAADKEAPQRFDVVAMNEPKRAFGISRIDPAEMCWMGCCRHKKSAGIIEQQFFRPYLTRRQ